LPPAFRPDSIWRQRQPSGSRGSVLGSSSKYGTRRRQRVHVQARLFAESLRPRHRSPQMESISSGRFRYDSLLVQILFIVKQGRHCCLARRSTTVSLVHSTPFLSVCTQLSLQTTRSIGFYADCHLTPNTPTVPNDAVNISVRRDIHYGH